LADYLVTYDVDTTTQAGARRLRHVARLCEGHGLRVQYSVFELTLEPRQLLPFIARLRRTMNDELDSARIYKLGEPPVTLGRRRPDETSRGALLW
jgi:CRISPR-associated protein Cas2